MKNLVHETEMLVNVTAITHYIFDNLAIFFI